MKVFKFLMAGVVAGTMLASCGGSNPPFESVYLLYMPIL